MVVGYETLFSMIKHHNHYVTFVEMGYLWSDPVYKVQKNRNTHQIIKIPCFGNNIMMSTEDVSKVYFHNFNVLRYFSTIYFHGITCNRVMIKLLLTYILAPW